MRPAPCDPGPLRFPGTGHTAQRSANGSQHQGVVSAPTTGARCMQTLRPNVVRDTRRENSRSPKAAGTEFVLFKVSTSEQCNNDIPLKKRERKMPRIHGTDNAQSALETQTARIQRNDRIDRLRPGSNQRSRVPQNLETMGLLLGGASLMGVDRAIRTDDPSLALASFSAGTAAAVIMLTGLTMEVSQSYSLSGNSDRQPPPADDNV